MPCADSEQDNFVVDLAANPTSNYSCSWAYHVKLKPQMCSLIFLLLKFTTTLGSLNDSQMNVYSSFRP